MGVTLRYCDLCGAKLDPSGIDGPETLKVKDKIFCPTCSPKVLAQIQKQRAAKAAGGAGARPAPQATGKPAKQGAAGTAPPRGSAPARRKAVPPQAPRASSPQRKAPSKAPRSKAPGRSRSTTPAPPSKRKAAGPSGMAPPPSRTKPSGKAPAPGKGKREPAPVESAAGTPPEGEGPGEFHLRKRSSAPIFVGIAVGVVAIGVVAFFLMQQSSRKPTETATTAKVEKHPVDPNEALAKEALKDAEEFAKNNPDKIVLIIEHYQMVGHRFNTYAPGKEASQKATSLLESTRTKELQRVADLEKKVKDEWKNGKFAEAFAQVKDPPPVVEAFFGGGELTDRYRALSKRAKSNLDAYKSFQELEGKAMVWGEKGYPEISKDVIDNFPATYRDTEVWPLKEKAHREIEEQGIASWMDKEKKAAENLAAIAEAKRKKREEARRQRWEDLKKSTAWVPQLNKHANLYNWVASSDVPVPGQPQNWQAVERDGTAVLVANNNSGHDIYTGVFTNHWEDYVLQFDMRLLQGSLQISPRTQFQTSSHAITADSRPLIDLSSKDYPQGDWVTITMEVHGDHVELRRSDKPGDKKDFEKGDDFRLQDTGGFLFWVPDKSHVELRNIRTQLITSTRSRLY